jgi:hypothetical protein
MSNPYSQFIDLLPKTQRWLGEIVGVAPGNKYEVTVLTGGTAPNVYVTGTGTYSSGDNVFVENGIIVSTAPPLRTITTEIIQ